MVGVALCDFSKILLVRKPQDTTDVNHHITFIAKQLMHPMMTSSTGTIFCVTGPLCGEFTGPGVFPTQRPVTRSFDVSFELRLNKRLSKQPWGWWFETPPWSLWRQCNANVWLPERSPAPALWCIVMYDLLRALVHLHLMSWSGRQPSKHGVNQNTKLHEFELNQIILLYYQPKSLSIVQNI